MAILSVTTLGIGGVWRCSYVQNDRTRSEINLVVELQPPPRPRDMIERVSLGVQSDPDFCDTVRIENIRDSSVFNVNP